MSVFVNVIFKVKTDMIDSFLTIMKGVQEELPTVNGCISVIVTRGLENSNLFTLFEQWESKDLHQDHIKNIIGSGVWDIVLDHLSEEPVSNYLKVI